MASELPIGPNPCQVCSEDYGQHKSDCRLIQKSEAEKAFEEAWNKNDIGPYDLQAMRWFHVGYAAATERAAEIIKYHAAQHHRDGDLKTSTILESLAFGVKIRQHHPRVTQTNFEQLREIQAGVERSRQEDNERRRER